MNVRPSPERMAAWRALIEAHGALLCRLEQELEAERGLPLSWYEVLLRLSAAEGGRLRMSELAGSVLLSRSGVTRLVDRMERAGLVRRETCPSDRRGAFAALTPAGKAALRRAAPVHLRGIEEHFARYITDEEARVLASALGRVLRAVRGDGAPGRANAASCG